MPVFPSTAVAAAVAVAAATDSSDMTSRYAPFKRNSKGCDKKQDLHTRRFNEFANHHGCAQLEDFTLEKEVTKVDDDGNPLLFDIFSCYGSYVLDLRKGLRGELYQPTTLQSTFAGPYNSLKSRFQSAPFLHTQTQWWDDLYADFTKQSNTQHIDQGGRISQNTEGIRRHQAEAIVDRVMRGQSKRSDTHTITLQDMQMRAVMVIQRQAIGRPGETPLVTLSNGVSWEDGRMHMDWSEHKNAKSTSLDFYPDVGGFLLCPYHALASWIMVDPGVHDWMTALQQPDDPVWLFPRLCQNNLARDSVASKVTVSIREAIRAHNAESINLHVGLHPTLSSHGLRAGAADDVLLSVHCLDTMGVLLGAIFRGGWELQNECVLLRYLNEKRYIAMAGKILAGYKRPEQFAELGFDCQQYH